MRWHCEQKTEGIDQCPWFNLPWHLPAVQPDWEENAERAHAKPHQGVQRQEGGGGMTFWMPWLDVTKSSFGSRNGGGHYIAGFWVFVPSTPGGGLSPPPERVGAWDKGLSWPPAIQPGTKTCSSGQAAIRQCGPHDQGEGFWLNWGFQNDNFL